MPRDPRAYLHDMAEAARLARSFMAGRTLESYLCDPMLRSAVERQLEILGEALARLARHAPETAARLTDWRAIIGLRNVLIHGYAAIDDARVFRIVHEEIDRLEQEVTALLAELDPSDGPPPAGSA